MQSKPLSVPNVLIPDRIKLYYIPAFMNKIYYNG